MDDEEFTLERRDASPAHLLIKIESFSMLSKYGVQKYESSEFVAGDYKWRLIIYPNGSEMEGDYISAYLSMVETSSLPMDWEVHAMFNIFLYDHILDKYWFRGKARRFHAINSEWGFSRLISKEIFAEPSNGYLVHDNCAFGAEVFVIKSQRVIERVSMLKVTNPYKHDWKISQFSKVEDVWTSEEFSAGGHRWNILLYPNGNVNAKGRDVSIFLESVDSKSFLPHEKVRADICMRIKNNISKSHCSRNFCQWFTFSLQNWGFPEFMSIADMRNPSKGFLVDDCCYLEIEISVQAVVRDASKAK